MPIGPARMPLLDHLGELRRRLMIIVVCLIASAIVLYMATPVLIEFLKAPITPFLPQDGQLNLLTPLSGFSIRFKVALYAAVIVCSPLIIWQIMAFFLPALKPSERKWVVPTITMGIILFIFGLVFCYGIILRPAFQWMTDQSAAIGRVLPTAENYIRIILLFELAFGIAFELPLLVFYLIVFNIVSYKYFRKNWRLLYLVLLVLSAMVTPDASPVTMAFMFAAMVLLYELALFISRIVLARRIKQQALNELRDMA